MIKSLEYLNRFKRNISFLGIINAFKFFVKIKNLDKAEILYLCHDNSRPVFLNNKFYSPLIDSINSKLNKFSNLTLALPFSKYSGDLAFGNTINLNLYILIALFKRVLFFRSISLKNIEKDPLVLFYANLIKKIEAKIIIGIQPSTEICLAANKNQVEVFDVQHGIIELEDRLSYYSLAKRKFCNNIGWPNYILCRNEQTFDKVSKLISYTEPMMIGNLNKYFYSNIYVNHSKKMLFENNYKTILFTFQPLYDNEFEANNNCEGIIFPIVLLKLILNSKNNYILKLHPSQIQNLNIYKKYIEVFDKLFSNCNNVDYVICNENPLEHSLTNSDLHITFNSACVLDALDYNLNTVLLDNNMSRLNNYFGELMESDRLVIDPGLKIDFTRYFKNSNEMSNKDLNYFLKFTDYISAKVL